MAVHRDFVRVALADDLAVVVFAIDHGIETGTAANVAYAVSTVASGANDVRGMGLVADRQLRDEGGEELLTGGAGGGELRFQLVHQGHQLIHFRHDPALFGKGGE